MKIREAIPDDLKEISLLFDAYRVFYKQSSNILGAKDFISDRLSLKDSKIYVAEEKNKLFGFVQLYPRFSSTQLKRTWLLNDLFVSLEARGQQLGVRLIERAKVLAVTTNSVGLMLETEKTNTIGNNLYPKVDFLLDELHNFYYWDVKK
ncbi:ribosomal protein S18 acetylase RimI-like enzyme [Gillisia mitskevichiae]|uniref:Ribosomal protein S18 acetylase RimI-like enzyme n=1 Tax=Gillisia mitskevichiae TaxID=270921 RepID=A0A495PXB0_9FLAO|nr:GNAT family N-acetyltransferase [Gillisia mitskevichiae]RKS55785.1 ribosomal protein S18 acetylase RimI-like enzyme [Gillisia mitskevichiae]